MKNLIENIIKSIEDNNNKIPYVNPTVVYNEGWMIRALVYQSIEEKINLDGINFGEIENWTSEGLISSPFTNTKDKRETHTHPDIAFGDFKIDYSTRGEIVVNNDSKFFGIIEAKMGSNLSKGTKNAPNYNQASRSLACACHQTHEKDNCEICFIVAAPDATLKKYSIKDQTDQTYMINQIRARFNEYPKQFKDQQNMESILKKAESCKIMILSFEDWVNILNHKEHIHEFYKKAKKWNRIKD